MKYAVQSLIFFTYWTYFLSLDRPVDRKKITKNKEDNHNGRPLGQHKRDAAIQSFGKAFLLPFDVLLGWIFTNEKRQRLLSRAANTIVSG